MRKVVNNLDSNNSASKLSQALKLQEEVEGQLQAAKAATEKIRIEVAKEKAQFLVKLLTAFAKDVREGVTQKSYRQITAVKQELESLDGGYLQKFLGRDDVYGLGLDRPTTDFFGDLLDAAFKQDVSVLKFFARLGTREQNPDNPFSGAYRGGDK